MKKPILKANRLVENYKEIHCVAIQGSRFYITENSEASLLKEAFAFGVNALKDSEQRTVSMTIGNKAITLMQGASGNTYVACTIPRGAPIRKSLSRIMRSIINDLEVSLRVPDHD